VKRTQVGRETQKCYARSEKSFSQRGRKATNVVYII
jgi:hypothetical protein